MHRFFLIASLLAFVAVGAVAQELTVGVDLSTTGEMAAIGIRKRTAL